MDWTGIIIFPLASVILAAIFCGIISILRKTLLIKIKYTVNGNYLIISLFGNEKEIFNKMLKREVSKHISFIHKTGSLVPEEVFVKKIIGESDKVIEYYEYKIIKYLKENEFLNKIYDLEK